MAEQVGVAVVLLLCLGGAHGSTPAQDCEISSDVVSEGSQKEIFHWNGDNSRTNKVSTPLYMRPESDFKGVSLKIVQGNSSHEAWFTADGCYAEDIKWWIQLGVNVTAIHIKDTLPYLQFDLNIGNCTRKCNQSSKVYYIRSLSIVAHGSSSWGQTKPPDTCLAPTVSGTQQNPPSLACTGPPSHATTSTASTAVMIIVIAVLLVVAMAVMVSACVIYRKRQRRQQEASQVWRHQQPDPATTTDFVHVTENSLYESFDGPLTPATREQQETVVRENSLYESFDGPLNPATREQQETVVRENSLYESFDGPLTPATREQQETVVRENCLYESFDGPLSPATRVQQATVVRENGLYESFSGPLTPTFNRGHN